MSHDFHFVLSNALKEKIINYSSVNNKSYSQSIVYIYNIMKPVLMKHFFLENNCEIISDGEEAEMNLHVYFEKKDYNFLKQIHSNFQTFSIAMLLRWILESFFNGLNKYGVVKFKKMIRKYYQFFLKEINMKLNKNKKISNNIKKQTIPKIMTKHMYSRDLGDEYIIIKLCKKFNYLGVEFT